MPVQNFSPNARQPSLGSSVLSMEPRSRTYMCIVPKATKESSEICLSVSVPAAVDSACHHESECRNFWAQCTAM